MRARQRTRVVLWLGATALVCALPRSGLGSPTVILTDGSVAQYMEAASAVKSKLRGGSEVVDVSTTDNPVALALRASPRVIVAVGQKALALAAGRVIDTPIIYCTVLYPEKHGLTGGNISGVPLEVPMSVQLERFRLVAPGAKRLGIIYSSLSGSLVEEATLPAQKLGLFIVGKIVSSSREVGDAFNEIASRIDALWLLPDAKVLNKDVFAYLLRATLDRGIPLFGFLEGFTQAGALASISPDYADIGARAGELANQVLSGRSIPAKVYSPGALSINLRTAQRLGIGVNDQAVKLAAKVFR